MSGDLNGQLKFACEAKWWIVFTVTEAYEVTEGKSAQRCGKFSRRTMLVAKDSTGQIHQLVFQL